MESLRSSLSQWILKGLSLALIGLFLQGCGGGGGGNGSVTRNPNGTPTPADYTVGGTISGLTGTLEIQNNGGDTLSINNTDKNFTFPSPVTGGKDYNVTILKQPAGQQCAIVGGQGAATNSDINSVLIGCFNTLKLSTQSLSQSVTLKWNDISASSYNLFYTTSPNCDFTQFSTCAGGKQQSGVKSPYTVTGLTNTQPYYFYIEADEIGGFQTNSNIAGAKPNTLVVNGKVNAIALSPDNSTVYLGGEFTQMGASTGGGVTLDATDTGSLRGDLSPLVNGPVITAVSDAAGGWYIGGVFTEVGGKTRNNLAHIRADGTIDPAWKPNVNDAVSSIILANGTVYVGGSFTMATGSNTRNYLAAFKASDGSLLSWDPNANGAISSLALSTDGKVIYAGGPFTTLNGVTYNHLAAINSASVDPNGTAVQAWNPDINSTVSTLYVSNGIVYIGGTFSAVGTAPNTTTQKYLAAIYGYNATTTPGSLVTSWTPSVNDFVYMITGGTNDTIYVGGAFTAVNGFTRNHLAAINTSNTLLGWNPSADSNVLGMADYGDTLYVSGEFSSINTSSRHGLAAIGSDGTLYDWNPNANGVVDTVATDGNAVYAGGTFTSVGETHRNHLAAISTAQGTLQSWAPDADAIVYALVTSGSTVYAGGTFTTIGGTAHNYLAAIGPDGTASQWNPVPNAPVYALAINGNTVYAGGAFSSVGGSSRNGIAALGTNGVGTILTWTDLLSQGSTVRALALSKGTIYAGGNLSITDSNAKTHTDLVAFNTADGTLQSSWAPNPNSTVYALHISYDGAILYAGGAFTYLNLTNPQNYIAAFNTSDGSLSSWYPAVNSTIDAITDSPDGSTIYLGGQYTSVNGTNQKYLAAINRDTTGTLQTWSPALGNYVSALAATTNSVFAGGRFLTVNGQPLSYFAFVSPP